jgi:hypothetical protein
MKLGSWPVVILLAQSPEIFQAGDGHVTPDFFSP